MSRKPGSGRSRHAKQLDPLSAPARRPEKHAHCRELLLRMARGVEGDLSAAERRALQRHLAGCRRCGRFSNNLQRTIALCRAAGAPAMSTRARARARGNVRRFLKGGPSQASGK